MWVPFELGRPFGAPDEPEFQTRVLRDVLALFEHEGPSPVLEDFPDDAPGGEMDMTGWTCPIALPSVAEMEIPELLGAVLAEIDGLAPWHQVAIENRGRTATGVLGIPIKENASFLFEEVIRLNHMIGLCFIIIGIALTMPKKNESFL